MPRPLLSVVIPTIGRPTLARTLASIRRQAPAAQCQIVVVADTHAGTFAADLAAVPALCARYAAFGASYDGGSHCYGQQQRQHGMTLARGRWLLFGQDDSAWLPGAWETIAGALRGGPAVPHLFRVQTWQAGVVPRNHRLELGNCDADGIAVPNDPTRLGTWGLAYTGDYSFIQETVALYDGQVEWVDTVIAAGRHWADRLGVA